LEQPSFENVLPSSHASPAVFAPSLHGSGEQLDGWPEQTQPGQVSHHGAHPSLCPATLLPSSQVSVMIVSSPTMPFWQ
jgi:hypothetical protein